MVRTRRARELLEERVAWWERGREPAYERASEAHRMELYALLLDLDRSLSPAQRARAQDNLRRYARDFAALAARRGS
jgi:hypothetical protein